VAIGRERSLGGRKGEYHERAGSSPRVDWEFGWVVEQSDLGPRLVMRMPEARGPHQIVGGAWFRQRWLTIRQDPLQLLQRDTAAAE
jgi:hypothetical protein